MHCSGRYHHLRDEAGRGFSAAAVITSRLVVPSSGHDEIVERVNAHLSNLKVGNPAKPDTYMGPLISQTQREKVDGADTDRAMSVARRIRTGTVGVNGGVWFAPDAPFGGYKQSGIGREMGVAGLAEFLETKTIAVPAG